MWDCVRSKAEKNTLRDTEHMCFPWTGLKFGWCIIYNELRGDKRATYLATQTVLCIVSFTEQVPSSPRRGMIEEDQDTAQGLVSGCCSRLPAIGLRFSPASQMCSENIIALH